MRVVPHPAAAAAPAPYAAAEAAFTEAKAYLSSREARQMSESDLERELHRRGQELMQKLLQGHLDQRSPGEAAGPVAGSDGVECRERRVHKRAVETIFGTVDVGRVGYARPGHESLHPLDASLNLPGIRLPGAGLIFSSGNGRKWTEPPGKLLHDEVVPAQICRHRGVGLCGCEGVGNEGRLAGRRTCAEHVAVESAHGRLAVPLSPRQLVGASSAATVGPAGSLAERWVWRLRGAPRSPAAARDHAGPGDGAAAMRTRGGDRRREQRRAAWWRSRRWRRNPRVAGSGGGGTARIECGPGARRRTGSG